MGYRVKPFTMSVRNNSTQEFEDIGLLGSNVDADISEMREDIAELQRGKKYFFICDSYGYGYGTTEMLGWMYYVGYTLGLAQGVDFWNLSSGLISGGYGMATSVAGEHASWADLMDAHDWTNVPVDEITDVIIAGGTNDRGYVSTIAAGMAALNTKIRAKFPNVSRITLVPLMTSKSISHWKGTIHSVYEEYSQCIKYGWEFEPNAIWSLHVRAYIGTDGVHPTNIGYQAAGKTMAQVIAFGHCDVEYSSTIELYSSTVSDPSHLTTLGTEHEYIRIYFKNGITTIKFQGATFGLFDDVFGVQLLTGAAVNGVYSLTSLPTFLIADGYGYGNTYPILKLESPSGYYTLAAVVFRDNNIQVQMIKSGGSGTLSSDQSLWNVCSGNVVITGWEA